MYDIIIVGAGTAGLTAAIYGRRALKKVLVFEANSYGGQIINTLDIENYPGFEHIDGYTYSTKLLNQAQALGAEILFEKVIDIKDNGSEKEVITVDNIYKTKTIILATGSSNRKLGLDNEKEFLGKGVSYCATCDGAFFKGKEVAVVGGGNAALEEAIYLADIVNKVYLIHRKDTFSADDAYVERLKSKENVEFVYNSNVTKLIGNDKLESIEITNNNGEIKDINIACLFVSIGQVPENNNFAKLINIDEKGYIIAGEDCHTNVEGIYVAGDTRTKSLRQLVTAAGDGAVAATEAIIYVNKMRN